MRVLIACEYSGVVRDAFRALGHDAMSCDLLPTDAPGPHYQGDVLDVLDDGWELMIAHPPCTYLTNAGVRHLHSTPSRNGVLPKVHGAERWAALDESAQFFRTLLDAPIPRIAVENPIPHRYAVERIGRTYDQVVQPWQFGHPESKRTCLWLKALPPLMSTENVLDVMTRLPKREQQRLHHLPPSPDRWKIRSQTFPGIARAMAEQWGSLD